MMIQTWRRIACTCALVLVCGPLSVAGGAQSAVGDQNGPFLSGMTGLGLQNQSNVSMAPQIQSTPIGPKSLDQPATPANRNDSDNGTRTERNFSPATQNPLEPVQLTAFQRLVAASVGKVIPIFGTNLFTNVPSTFSPVDHIPVTPSYVIGPGDELLIRLWGQVTLNGRFTVDRSGNVYIPQVGAVQVAGVPFEKVTDYLRTEIGHNFRNFDINVNMGQLRSIQIFIVGEAKHPGSYTVSSLSSLVNALFASGGPTPMGSMRDIQVKRDNKVVTSFDLYDLLLKGDKSKDVPLLSGDVIYIPPVGPMVALVGSVNVPALYEIKPGSNLQDVFKFAGGLSTLAQTKEVRVERILHQGSRSTEDIKLDFGGLATSLSDGDLIEVAPIVDRFKDAVTLRGNVANPRRFAWFPGMRIKDLIPDKDALLTRDYWQQRNLLGLPVLDSTPDVRRYAPDAPVAQVNGIGVGPVKSPELLNAANGYDSDTNVYGNSPLSTPTSNSNSANDNSSMQNASVGKLTAKGDLSASNNRKTRVGTESDIQADSSSNASGTSISASVTGVTQRFPVKNTVILSAPEIDWAYAVIERLNRKDLTTQLLPFNLGRAVLDGDNSQNLELEPGDVVTIFSKADIRVPQAQQTKYVRLEGEFNAAGTYSVAPGETLRHLVARVGGLTSNAYLYGSEFSRESTRVLQQQRLNDYAADLDRRIKLAEANSAMSAMSPQDQIADVGVLNNARDVAMRLRQLNASGRIVLNVKPDSKTVADIPDIPLEDGDTFVVPQVPTSVDVFGAVYTQSSFLYDSHKRASDYIRQAGGGTRTADVRRSYIVRADGAIISRQYSSNLFAGHFNSTHLYPGDAVVVPEQVDRRPLLRNLVDIATIVGQFGLGFAAINVLK